MAVFASHRFQAGKGIYASLVVPYGFQFLHVGDFNFLQLRKDINLLYMNQISHYVTKITKRKIYNSYFLSNCQINPMQLHTFYKNILHDILLQKSFAILLNSQPLIMKRNILSHHNHSHSILSNFQRNLATVGHATP